MKNQIIKDTAEYNYNLGYLKAIEEFEKIIDDFDFSLNSNCKLKIFSPEWNKETNKEFKYLLKQQFQKLKEKKQ